MLTKRSCEQNDAGEQSLPNDNAGDSKDEDEAHKDDSEANRCKKRENENTLHIKNAMSSRIGHQTHPIKETVCQ